MATKTSTRPADVFARIGQRHGVILTTRMIVDDIVATFDLHTASDLEQGATWYSTAGEICRSVVGQPFTPTLEHAVVVFADLSPRTTVARNTAGLFAFATGGADACRAVGCMASNVDRAARTIGSDDPLATIGATAPKVNAFAANILGDTSRVTIDVWATRVALRKRLGEDADLDAVIGWTGVYAALEHAYRLAAARRAVEPSTMQAVTWIVARGGRAW